MNARDEYPEPTSPRTSGSPSEDRPASQEKVLERGAGSGDGPGDTPPQAAAPLFTPEQAESLRTRWDAVQAEFVDEPRSAVEKADVLVGDVMERLSDGFRDERTRLEREWDRGDGVSTEDLRVALKRYRSFFDRLLSI